MRKKLDETATGGATSAGAVATVVAPLNFSMQRRLPPTNLFGYSETSAKNVKKPKKK